MFPNPQSALPLPPHPSLERYRKLAKDLVKACKSGDPASLHQWARAWVETLVHLSGLIITPQLPVRVSNWVDDVDAFARRHLSAAEPPHRACTLTAAQFVIARSHGFASWSKFSAHLDSLLHESSTAARFECAADAIVSGDIETLQRLLREDPSLIRARSTREHAATLLHYVAANGIEGYRQRTPPNIVDIAGILLRSGAEVDATTSLYGAQCTTLELAATSVHPQRAGVQQALLALLLDHGARLDPHAQPSQPLVSACLANGRIQAAEFLANRGALLSFVEVAALGRLDELKAYFTEAGSITAEQRTQGLLYACQFGRVHAVEALIENGADLTAHDRNGQTALHRAVVGGHPRIVEILLQHHPPLEVENSYGGTPLDQTLWSAAQGGDPDVYILIMEALFASGAKLPDRHVPINAKVDAWLAQHGSIAEPGWHWPGEAP